LKRFAWRKRRTGDASSEKSSQIAVDAGSHCDLRDIATALWSDGQHCAHVDADGCDTAEATAGVCCNNHRPVLQHVTAVES